MKKRSVCGLSAALLTALVVGGSFGGQSPKGPTSQDAPEYGPAKGTLVIVGGGPTNNTGIIEKFIQLAGGPAANFVVVPTAGGNKTADGKIHVYKEEDVVASWKKRGLKNVKMLHTHDPKIADTEEFAKPLREASAVWFDGGRQWNNMKTRKIEKFGNGTRGRPQPPARSEEPQQIVEDLFVLNEERPQPPARSEEPQPKKSPGVD